MGGFSAGFIVALPLAARLALRWQPGWNWRKTLMLMLAAHALLLALGGAVIALRGGDVGVLAVLLPGAGGAGPRPGDSTRVTSFGAASAASPRPGG